LKKWLIIAAVAVLVVALGVVVVGRGDPLRSSARRNWKQKSIAEITVRVANATWVTNELTDLKPQSTSERNRDGGWFSEHMILTRNGAWLAYANICHKQDRHIHDLFLARGSDGRWYYSTYHFCIGMVALRTEEQPEDLAGFAKTYFLQRFDGQSDDCLQKTWPLGPTHKSG